MKIVFIHSTQFFEFVNRNVDEATTDNSVHLPPVLFQPIAADDVVSALCKVATSSPMNDTIVNKSDTEFDSAILDRCFAGRGMTFE